jgi:hypothetical protein
MKVLAVIWGYRAGPQNSHTGFEELTSQLMYEDRDGRKSHQRGGWRRLQDLADLLFRPLQQGIAYYPETMAKLASLKQVLDQGERNIWDWLPADMPEFLRAK